MGPLLLQVNLQPFFQYRLNLSVRGIITDFCCFVFCLELMFYAAGIFMLSSSRTMTLKIGVITDVSIKLSFFIECWLSEEPKLLLKFY